MDDKRLGVLNPYTPEEKIIKIAECLNSNNMDYRHLLDVGTSAMLVTLLFNGPDLDKDKFEKCLNLAEIAGKMLKQQCLNDQQQLLAITYLLKSAVSVMIKRGF